MIRAQQVGTVPISGQQVPTVPLQVGTIPATTTATQLDINSIMNMMILMMVVMTIRVRPSYCRFPNRAQPSGA